MWRNRILDRIVSLKKEYHQWRYWNVLYRNTVKNIRKHKKKDTQSLIPYVNKPGIALSFDDSYRINDWYKYGKQLFGYYDVKVTFNINAIHPFEDKREHSQSEIDMLLELQSDGHEIGHHGYSHKKATEYSNKYGLEKWVQDDIHSLLYWMEKQSHSRTKDRFKKPVSFAFPNFLYNESNIVLLVPKYFKIVRGHLSNSNLADFNHEGYVPSICLDSYYSCNLFYIKKIMRLARKYNKNLIITCHSILPNDVNWKDFKWGDKAEKDGLWRINPKVLQAIIAEARENNMEFYTTSEIAGVATFIDYNFELAVREIISDPAVQWIPISELISIKELDISNKNINNLDGIQYFYNLESLVLSNNKINDLRILKKLPKLKKLKVDNNPISINDILKTGTLSNLALFLGINLLKLSELTFM